MFVCNTTLSGHKRQSHPLLYAKYQRLYLPIPPNLRTSFCKLLADIFMFRDSSALSNLFMLVNSSANEILVRKQIHYKLYISIRTLTCIVCICCATLNKGIFRVNVNKISNFHTAYFKPKR